MSKFIIPILLLTAISCRERSNLYDPGSDNFTAPPPIKLTYPTGGWYNQYGYLIGVRVYVEFTDGFGCSWWLGFL